jgi:hypothetical protein
MLCLLGSGYDYVPRTLVFSGVFRRRRTSYTRCTRRAYSAAYFCTISKKLWYERDVSRQGPKTWPCTDQKLRVSSFVSENGFDFFLKPFLLLSWFSSSLTSIVHPNLKRCKIRSLRFYYSAQADQRFPPGMKTPCTYYSRCVSYSVLRYETMNLEFNGKRREIPEYAVCSPGLRQKHQTTRYAG